MASQELVPVAVVSISGRELKLELSVEATVTDLKAKVMDAWKVPTPYQQFFVGTSPITHDDTTPLAGLAPGGDQDRARLLLNLVVSDTCCFERLLHGERQTRLDALRALVFTAARGDERVVETVVEALGLEDADEDGRGIRAAAAEALGQLAAPGCTVATAALSSRLQNGVWRCDWPARRAAVVSLGALSGGILAGGTLPLFLNIVNFDADWRVRLAAVETMSSCLTADEGGNLVVTTLVRRLEPGENTRVTHASLVALSKLTAPGHDAALVGLRDFLEQPWLRERKLACAAIEALGQIAAAGDEKTMATLRVVREKEYDEDVRAVAMTVLRRVSPAEESDPA